MKSKVNAVKNSIKRFKEDYEFRTLITSAGSFITTTAFAAYNLFLWFAYRNEWNIYISIYYALLACVRAYTGVREIKYSKAGFGDEEKNEKRKNTLLVQSVMLFVIDLALIAPISLMVMQKKVVNYSMIPAIAMAAYTVFKIVTASRNFVKTRSAYGLHIKMLRNVSFVDALVSVLSLQYTLIMTFGEGMEGDMQTLAAMTSLGIWVFLIVISVLTLIQAVKLKKE